MGTTLDLLKPGQGMQKNIPKPPSDKWRSLKYLLLIFVLAAAIFGNQSLLFLDPISIMTRTMANAIWPALGFAVRAVEGFLYQFDALWGPLDAIHSAVIFPIFRDLLSVYPLAVPVFLFFAGIVALNWWAERFWCRYLCPLGGLLGFVSRFSFFRRVVGEECSACTQCSRHCQTGTIDPAGILPATRQNAQFAMTVLILVPKAVPHSNGSSRIGSPPSVNPMTLRAEIFSEYLDYLP